MRKTSAKKKPTTKKAPGKRNRPGKKVVAKRKPPTKKAPGKRNRPGKKVVAKKKPPAKTNSTATALIEFPVLTIGNRRVQTSAIDQPDAVAWSALGKLFADADGLDRACRAAILKNARADSDGAARLYVTHHLAEIRELAGRFGVEDPENPSPAALEAFLDAMYVRSMWASPDSEDSFLHVDYTVDDRATQYVLSVATDRQGIVSTIEMES